ncbi:MAG: RNA methyltransferase, partial [Bdellovibrionales bacterium]|nr:RNA methyltransferase [Bdellovibrionales bacterium]
GLGVLRRNPHIKWQLDSNSLDRFPDLQVRLLGAYLPLVKPGGRLVYGVCTFRKSETSEVVNRFLGGGSLELEASGYLGPAQSDGFFMASFRRKG